MFTQSVSSAALEKAMSATWQKAELITHNIANEDTPGYKAKRLEFESLLGAAMESNMRATAFDKTSRISRINNLQPVVYSDDSHEVRIDGNNVDIDSEQMELARTQIQYQALRDRVSGHYSLLKYAISGGR
ncbi:MAG: flagellar basal body rod protein FlgB [Oscillospiraceae bacterium]|jgi:flagellar basal-body rod protein FlgB|nr:flagellar basal body rod protein FlgB [Oscillospiraceae bacterium]